jgi:glycosyltransferase involved in cell wall biosynthesis
MSNIVLSILVPTLPTRTDFHKRLIDMLASSIYGYCQTMGGKEQSIEIITNDRVGISIGAKRNIMLQESRGDYICFIDDDDRIADNYIELVMAGIATNPDCCSLNGIIMTDGKDPKPFKHSIEYDSMYERDGVYYRPPNHLNTVRASIAKQMVFPDWQRSEDSNYCFQLQASGLLKVEYKIEPVLYYYDYVSDKRY